MKHNNLDAFIDNLIQKRGYGDASSEIRSTLHRELKRQLDEFIMTRSVTEFSEEDLRAFEKMLDEDRNPSEIHQFIITHIPDYSTFLTGTLLTFQDTYLSQ